MLLDGLPQESRVASSPIGGWTPHTELLAQLIEEVSVLAADRRRESPRTIARPYATAAAVPTGNSPAEHPAPQMTGHRKMLAAAARRGMVHPGA
ncbi:hypothetical protein OHS33_38670 (plasmid) [Streptomyces sp. NBC_00536]|uniref:hypothetical protein n=1 Tax=Streptomyces sp. NBC_00536 TaxID=2975769 RepID=UPI002E8238C9|nr:hypothetical protein [Streptomyces sp. NBC_00536]WUC84427.1 hypothetical protein OHS33_38670 [Streptomyces sp. NBC_00536]